MKIKKGQTLELFIQDAAFGGKGLAKLDKMAVFVDRAVPGDKVMARIIKKKKSYAEARVEKLLSPSDLRVDPPCPYSGMCGGCRWQHLAYEKQVEFKGRHVAEALVHIGLLADPPVLPAAPSDEIFGYRNKMEFSCADREWLMPQDLEKGVKESGFALGLHVPGTFYKVLNIEACLLMPPVGSEILQFTSRFMRHSGLAPYGIRSHEGFWRFLVLRHSVAHDNWLVNLITSEYDEPVLMDLAAQIVNRFPNVASVKSNVTTRKAQIAVGEKERHLKGDPCLYEEIGPYRFRISANSFFQTNTKGARHLYDTVKEFARLKGFEEVLDLYCGTGSIGIYLSDSAASITGIEINQGAVDDAGENARINQVDNCRFLAGDLKDVLGCQDVRPDVVVVDPPRAGMHPRVVKTLADMGPKRIVYVSCNPATMARDMLLLKEHYHLARVKPVDLFPHTWHIESVARLERIRPSMP